MKNRLLLKLFAFAVIVGMAFTTSCKDYDDDINRLSNENSTLKTELAALSTKIDGIKAELTKAIDDKIKTVTDEITALKAQLKTLEENSATKAELDAVKKEILEKTVSLEVFNNYKGEVAKELQDLKDELAKAATKDELEAYKLVVKGEFTRVEGLISALDLKVDTLETTLRGLITQLGKDLREELDNAIAKEVIDRNAAIAALRLELDPRITTLEAILDVQEGKSLVIADIYEQLGKHKELLDAHADSIKDLRDDMDFKYNLLVAADKELQRQITDNRNDITKIQNYIKNELEPRLKGIEDDIKGLQGRMTNAEKAIQLNITNILTLSRQLKGLTFIPTRGLPSEKTMKFYYFAGDYSANHTLMYRVNPSNAKLGRDFTIESLNYQITTRSASDGVADGSELVSVKINGEVTQEGDIIYVPVHVEGPAACDVFGNHDWWCNEFYFGSEYGLKENNFPAHVVKTVKNPNVKYSCGNQNRGLSLVLTALTKSVEEVNGVSTASTDVYVKSSEMMNTELVPTQIKLAESRDGKGNQIIESNLAERLLKTTLEDAADWANLNENNLPANNKNWNVLAWSGNQGQGGVWTPGEIDLYDYVSSFYYPQDGGDLSRANTVQGDPHRFLYAEFGKEFGKPYFDKPHYAKPVYEFEQMIYRDTNHNIVIGPKGGKDVTHTYVKLDGSKLTVLTNEIQNIRNKKIIIKVTQVNSDCEERQPVGYLVLKYSDSPLGVWPDVDYTIDLTSFPYYHKECQEEVNGAGVIPRYYTPLGAGSQATHKDALLGLFTADRFMSPINAPASYGLAGEINPGDVNVMLSGSLQLNGIGEHNMGNIYNIQTRDASVVPNSPKFTAAAYNHVNDAENKPATEVTAADAFKHVMIRYEYDNHSYIVYVDDQAPAGDYEITYKLENKENNTQHGNILYLTFKFKVALRKITVEHDANTVNWQDDNTTIRVQHTRIHNTIAGHSHFLTDQGYRVDLKEAFVLTSGTTNMTTGTLPADDAGATPGAAPNYRPMFEFIQDAGIKAAGFEYKRDANNYLTRIELNGQLAARIDNAATFNYLYIAYNKEGDLLYNYLTQNMLANNNVANHNEWTKWGKVELTNLDDMERKLPVRMVTDINGACVEEPAVDRFPNGNYYYIDDFKIKFERALRWAFTTVELKDDQTVQTANFDFFTKTPNTTNDALSVYRGLFDHAYYNGVPEDHGYGNLVHPSTVVPSFPYQFGNPYAEAWFYGLKQAPELVYRPNANPLLALINYELLEISTDGGNTWQKADYDYSIQDHIRRFFTVTRTYVPTGMFTGYYQLTAVWQGNQTAITSDIYFRLPVYNKTAKDNGLAPDADGKYWMTYRAGHAKAKGYAVFKIKARQNP